MSIKLNYSNLFPFLSRQELEPFFARARQAQKTLLGKDGPGVDFLGWVDLPVEITEEQILRLESSAKEIRSKCDAFITIGIGGSYLGGRAVSEALLGAGPVAENPGCPAAYYAGHNISAVQMNRLLSRIENRDVCLNVISKSGTTTEPGIAFRILRGWMEKKYGQEASSRIIATTDRAKGALHNLAKKKGYETFIIPDDVGGRFSVLTPVGLLPLAVSGIDIRSFIEGFKSSRKRHLKNDDPLSNPALFYAAARNALYEKGKTIEVLSNFESDLHGIAEWWKQLFGESEGKEEKGIFPAAVDFPTDLHSMGQYLQNGKRDLFETFLMVGEKTEEYAVPEDPEDSDGLNFLAGLDFAEVNLRAYNGTKIAHYDGGVPNMTIWLNRIDAESIGELLYFFELAVAFSGYMLGVNPFDQPGVEDYKKNMFALLGKPGFEELGRELQNRQKESGQNISG